MGCVQNFLFLIKYADADTLVAGRESILREYESDVQKSFRTSNMKHKIKD